MLPYAFLGLVQGLAEFLPISSSAHLIFVRRWLGVTAPASLLVAFLHLGTLLALLIWFRKDLVWLGKALLPSGEEPRRYLGFLLLGLLPLFPLAVFVRGKLEGIFSSVRLSSAFLLVTAGFLFLSAFLGRPRGKPLTPGKSLLIGFAQALAIFPGISRSGATLAVGLLLGLEKGEAFRFSFLLGIPTFLGAALLSSLEAQGEVAWPGLALGCATAFFSGLLALGFLWRTLSRRGLWPFGLYCLLLGLFGLLWG